MNKKIIFFIPNIDDGGIEKNLILLSNFFHKNRCDVKIIYSRISPNIKRKINTKINLKKIKNYFNFSFLNTRVNNSLNCFLYSLINLKFSKETILFSMQDHPYVVTLSFLKNIPSIIRIANHPVGSLKFFNNKILFQLKLGIKIFFYQFASVIICNSNESRDYFKKKFLKKKIYSIYNPINNKFSKKKFIRNKYELVTIGRIEKQKNVEGLISAISFLIKEIPRLKLTIVGKGSEKKKLIKYVKNLKLKKHIYFKNFSPPNIYLAKKGVLILNSLFEGLPNILIEGIQYKIPIISTKCQSGPKEILKNGKYGTLVNVNDPVDMSNKIKKVIFNYRKSINKSKIASKSLQRFAIDKQCKKYLKIIKAL